MEELFSRTSVTIDEAVGILIGWLRGPFNANIVIDEYTNETEYSAFYLAEALRDTDDLLESEYAEAIYDRLPAADIEKKLIAIQEHRTLCKKAKKYLCDIKDELTKGKQSALRYYGNIEDRCAIEITLSSLNEWTNTKYSLDILSPNRLSIREQEINLAKKDTTILSPDTKVTINDIDASQEKSNQQKLLRQEEVILHAIKDLGHNPKSIPKNTGGRPGFKSTVRHHLKGNDLFVGRTVFDKAWERLRKNEAITDQT